jgi:hypothetical protein
MRFLFENVAWGCKVEDTRAIHDQVQLRLLVVAYRAAAISVSSAILVEGVKPFELMTTEQRCKQMGVWQSVLAVMQTIDDVYITFKLVSDNSQVRRHQPAPIQLAFPASDNGAYAVQWLQMVEVGSTEVISHPLSHLACNQGHPRVDVVDTRP